MTRLYELAGAYAALQDRAESGEDVADALAELNDALEVKAERVAYVLRNLSADEEALDVEIKRLQDKKRTAANNRERLREYLRRSMVEAGILRVKCPYFVLSVSDGPESVEVVDEAQIPDEFTRTKREPNKAAILEAFRSNGECVPGTQVVRKQRLTVK